MSITAVSFYWRNDTPSFVTWQSRLATAPETPMCTVILGGQFTDRVHLPNQFVPEIVSPFPCSPALVRYTLLIVYFFKELISFIGSLDKCLTSVFNTDFSANLLQFQEWPRGFQKPRKILFSAYQKNQKRMTRITSILKVLHGNTKSPTSCMYSSRYNILLEVKEGI